MVVVEAVHAIAEFCTVNTFLIAFTVELYAARFTTIATLFLNLFSPIIDLKILIALLLMKLMIMP